MQALAGMMLAQYKHIYIWGPRRYEVNTVQIYIYMVQSRAGGDVQVVVVVAGALASHV